jgi:hypothetical protein
MTKIIITFFVIGYLTFITPVQEAIADPIPIVKSPVVVKVVHKAVVKKINIKYIAPIGKPLEIATLISTQTGTPVTIISKIMFAESRYESSAKHLNKNGTTDHGLMQINSSHITEAKEMGIDIFTDEGNASFAIHLIKTCGLSPWNSSKYFWGV